ncbi:MAG TPA: NUDIX domain-containing protein [Candidatus Saccharimonadales bacterium]|nr:NUDIX domain-containing protein [Candidatus Saccharimonadales bacterium]
MLRETVAKALLINRDHQVLVLRIGEYKGKPERSHTPDLPGGLVDPNESEHQAVIREIKEETGIEVNPNNLTLGYTETKAYPQENKSVTKMLYVGYLDGEFSVTISWEHEAYEWCDTAKLLDRYKFRPFYEEAIGYLSDNKLL